jgi:flagellar biosynthesis/type III secretory pathway protein FliH
MLCTVTLSTPVVIGSVSIADPNAESLEAQAPEGLVVTAQQTQKIAELETQTDALQQTCQIMQQAADQLSQTCQTLFTDHRDEIAKLAVEIARTVLMQQVLEGAYDIEAIVKESLSHAPTRENLTIRVNPQDLADCRAAQAGDKTDSFAGVQFVADTTVGRAECVLESPKGIIQSLLDEHLNQIGEALKKTA